MEDRIEKQIEVAAPLTLVWKAITDYRQFGEWFRVKLDGPFVAGQSVSGTITFPGYEHLRMDIVVQKIEPESYFSYTWHPYAIDPKADYSEEIPTLVEFTLRPAAQGTLVVVAESGFSKLPPERYADAFRMNTRGWEQQLENLANYAGKSS